jgi:UPF0176 protein
MKVTSFYKYVNLEDPQALHDEIRAKCEYLDIVGRILIAEEGINGACSGTEGSIETFKQFLDTKFQNLTFREQTVPDKTYHKLVVRVRPEIVALGVDANLENTGNHLEPEELKRMIDNKEDFIILDARNDYEFETGKFKNAMNGKTYRIKR